MSYGMMQVHHSLAMGRIIKCRYIALIFLVALIGRLGGGEEGMLWATGAISIGALCRYLWVVFAPEKK